MENPKNPNKHPDRQIELLAKIIDYQGQRSPIVVSKRSGFITKGHGRLMALKKLGWEKAAVDMQDYESEAQEYADVVADNKIAELAKHDDSMMIDEIKHLGIEDFELLGLENFDLPVTIDESKEEGENDLPENVDTRCKPGDVWLLGEHRLLCGDSTNIQHVEKLMDGNKADLIVTDPPYNVAYEDSKGQKIQNDSMDDSSFYDFLLSAFSSMAAVTKPGAGFYIFHADSEGLNFRAAVKAAGFDLKQCCIWVKDQFVMGRQDYHWQHEPILYGWLPGAAHHWHTDRKQTTTWNFERPKRGGEHPTMKPIKLLEYPIGNSSRPGQNVLDLFGGSGSTLITSEKLQRKCFMMELDPHYCDVILSRWEKYSGKEAKLSKPVE